MSDTKIRAYVNADFKSVVNLLFDFQLWVGSIGKESGNRSFKSKEESQQYLKQALRDVEEMNGFFLVAEESGGLVGFVYGVVLSHENDVLYSLTHAVEKEGWVGILFVDENNRKQGVGQKLMKEAGKYLKQQECSTLRLVVGSDNLEAMEFYSNLGFVSYETKMMQVI